MSQIYKLAYLNLKDKEEMLALLRASLTLKGANETVLKTIGYGEYLIGYYTTPIKRKKIAEYKITYREYENSCNNFYYTEQPIYIEGKDTAVALGKKSMIKEHWIEGEVKEVEFANGEIIIVGVAQKLRSNWSPEKGYMNKTITMKLIPVEREE